MNISIGSTGTNIVINGDNFNCSGNSQVSIVNGVVTINGDVQGEVYTGDIEVTVQGDVESVSAGSGSVSAERIGSVSTGSGDVSALRVERDVRTGSGDVECGSIQGNVKTGSGDVYHR